MNTSQLSSQSPAAASPADAPPPVVCEAPNTPANVRPVEQPPVDARAAISQTTIAGAPSDSAGASSSKRKLNEENETASSTAKKPKYATAHGKVNALRQEAVNALNKWRVEALKCGDDHQVNDACLSYFGHPDQFFKYFERVDLWELERAVRLFPLKPSGFNWVYKLDLDVADPEEDPACDNQEVENWVQLRGGLAYLLKEKEEVWQLD